MKTIAMFFIVAGHCWVPGYKYIFVFSVPCFFIISGFLSKRQSNIKLFWRKVIWNLLVPMFLYFVLNLVVQFAVQIANGSFELKYLYQAPFLAFVGMQGQGYEAGGLKAMWFVYTLIICKVILQFVPERNHKVSLIVISILFLLVAWFLHAHQIVFYNSIVDTLLAMPFFTLGFVAKPMKETLSNMPMRYLPYLIVVGLVVVWLCGRYNDIVMLYKCSYGGDLFMCITGGVFGTILIYAISKSLDLYFINYVRIIGGGTMVILGLHFVLIQVVSHFVSIQGVWLYIEALLIMICFLPIISFTEKYIPILYGSLRVSAVSDIRER